MRIVGSQTRRQLAIINSQQCSKRIEPKRMTSTCGRGSASNSKESTQLGRLLHLPSPLRMVLILLSPGMADTGKPESISTGSSSIHCCFMMNSAVLQLVFMNAPVALTRHYLLYLIPINILNCSSSQT